jgi:hypothetical protein
MAASCAKPMRGNRNIYTPLRIDDVSEVDSVLAPNDFGQDAQDVIAEYDHDKFFEGESKGEVLWLGRDGICF